MAFLVHLTDGQLPAAQAAFWRGLIACLVLLPTAARHLPKAVAPGAASLWTRSIAGAASILCYFWNLQVGGVGTATTYSNLVHIFVALIGWRFRGLVITGKQMMGIGLAVAGATVLSAGSASVSPRVVLVGVGGALAASVSYLALREAAQDFTASLVVWLLGAMSAIASLMVPGEWAPVGLQLGLVIAGIGIFGTLGQWLMTRSFLHLPPQVAGVLALTSLIWGVLFEILLASRRPQWADWASYALVLTGVAILRASVTPKADVSASP
jgi:drug/metabolite transporter (DMT)-like permease